MNAKRRHNGREENSTVDTAAAHSTAGARARAVLIFTLRCAIAGGVGYGVFAAGMLLARAYANLHGREQFISWPDGVLIASMFAGAEFLRAGRGRDVDVVRRLLISSAVLLAVGVILGITMPSEQLDKSRAAERESLRMATLATTVVAYAAGLLAAWCVMQVSRARDVDSPPPLGAVPSGGAED